jgi:uncharacterized protein YlaI
MTRTKFEYCNAFGIQNKHGINTASKNRERLERLRLKENGKQDRKAKERVKLGVFLDGNNAKQLEIPYTDYLMTGHWRRAREHAIKLADGKCSICQSTYRLNVHHLHYRSLWRERANDVVVLCETCHRRIHNKEESQE